MNEEQMIPYLNLVYELLNCQNGEESNILQQHQNLIDENLVIMSLMVAEDIEQQGNKNAAQWLRNFAKQTEEFISSQQQDLGITNDEEGWKKLMQIVVYLHQQGQSGKALEIAEQALLLAKNIWGEEHETIATSINNLALLYQSQGRLTEAEPLYLQALEMRKRLFKGDHQYVATSLNNLAGLYQSQGRLTEAEPLYLQALEMWKRLFKGDHPDVASSLNNLAGLYDSQGRLRSAEPLYLQALEMTKRLFKGDHPDVANSLNNLASLYNSQGRLTKAEPLYNQALEMRKRLFKGDHPDVAESLNNLAFFYKSQGRLTEAEPLYKDALEMWKRLFKGEHQYVANCLNSLAFLYYSQGRLTEALNAILEALAVEDRLMSREFVGTTEKERLRFLDNIRDNFDRFLSLVYHSVIETPNREIASGGESDMLQELTTHNPPRNDNDNNFDKQEAIKKALDVVLRRKGITASVASALNEAIYSGRYPHLQESFTQYRLLIEKLSFLQQAAPTPENQENLQQCQQNLEKIEKYLASEVPEIKQTLQGIDRRAVALELPEGSTLVEYVRFHLGDFKTETWQGWRYLAFILPHNQPDQVQMIDLGDAEPIDNLIRVFRDTASELRFLDNLDIGVDDDDLKLPLTDYNLNPAFELYQAIFKPIQSYLATNKLIIAADGNLSLVPFSLLPLETVDHSLLMDHYILSYLSTGKDILRYQKQTNRKATEPMILADPDFDWEIGNGEWG